MVPMSDFIVLIWVGFIFFGTVFFSCNSVVQLFQNNRIKFDRGFFLSLSACLVALILCLSIWPPLHRVYDDEPAYVSQSYNILSLGKPSVTIKGSRLQPEIFDRWTSDPKLPGYAWLEAVVLFLTKDFEQSYFMLNIVLGVLSVALLYRIAWLWTASNAVAWWAAIFLACLPARVTYSMSAGSDIAGLFFFLLFLYFISEFRSLNDKSMLYAAIFGGLFSICVKPLYGIFVVFGLAGAMYIYQRNGLLDRKLRVQILMDTVCLSLPILISIPVFLIYELKHRLFAFSFISENLFTSIFYLFDYKQNTILTVLAAIVAAGWGVFYKKDNLVIALTGWFLTGFLMFSMFCAGGFSYPGQCYSDRYFLFFAFPFVLLAAKGMADTLTGGYPRLLGTLFFMVLVINAFFASNHLACEAKNDFYNKETLLLRKVFPFIPNDAYIIDKGAVLVTMISTKRSILTDLFVNGFHPKKVVFMKGIYDNFYDPYDAKNSVLIIRILDTTYHCKPLFTSLLKEADLSATPLLCERN